MVPVCTLLPSGSVISGIAAPRVAEFNAVRPLESERSAMLSLRGCLRLSQVTATLL